MRNTPSQGVQPITPEEDEPTWVDDLRTLLKTQGEHMASIDTRLRAMNSNLTMVGRAYQSLAQEVALLRTHCSHCPDNRTIAALERLKD